MLAIMVCYVMSCRTGPHPEFTFDPASGTGVSNLIISIEDADGNGITNAEVYFGGTLFTSDASGKIDAGIIAQGTYEISCDHPDFMFFSDIVHIPRGDYNLTIELYTGFAGFAVRRVIPGLGPAAPEENGRFIVEFNQQIDEEAIDTTYFEFNPSLGDYIISAEGSTVTAYFEKEWPSGQTVMWKLQKSILSASGENLGKSYIGQFRVSSVDLSPPRLVRSSPSDGDSDVYRNQNITLTFSDEIDPLSASGVNIVVEPDLDYALQVDENRIMLKLDSLLASNTEYIVTISNIRDLSGNSLLSPAVIRFTTGSEIRRFKFRKPDWTRVGDKIVFESDESGNFDLYEINSDGTGLRRLTTNPADDLHPSYSYDGTQVVFERKVDGYWHIFRLHVDTGEEIQVTGGADNYHSPVYSSTYERRIAYLSDIDDSWNLWSSEEDGSIPREWLPGFGRSVSDPEYHPLLETQVVFSASGGLSRDIFKASGYPGDADTSWENLTDELAGDDRAPAYSPEGDIIAFISDTGETRNIWIMDFDGEFPRQLTSSDVAIDNPVYSPNFGEQLILAEVYEQDGSISLAFFDALSGELLSYLLGGEL